MGKMGAAMFQSPILHGIGNNIGDGQVQRLAGKNGFLKSLKGGGR